MTHTIEIALDVGPGELASVFVELEDSTYATARRVARTIKHAVGFRFTDCVQEPVSPWMYFGRTETANDFRDRHPERGSEIPDTATRVAVTRTGRVVTLDEFDQATDV